MKSHFPDHIHQKVFSELQKRKRQTILDVGTSKRFAKELQPYHELMDESSYYALGYKSTECDLSGDACKLPIKTNSVDLVICFEVLEHVANPPAVVTEFHRVLKPKGTVLLTTPFMFPYHGKSSKTNHFSHDQYPDLWRFTHQGLQTLFSQFQSVEVVPFTNTIGFYLHQIPILNQFATHPTMLKLEPIKLGNPTYRHLVIAEK